MPEPAVWIFGGFIVSDLLLIRALFVLLTACAGFSLRPFDTATVVESVKTASDIYAPVAGEIVEVNLALEKTPELVNQDPYGEGWIFRLKPRDMGDLDELLDAEGYQEVLESEA